MGSDVIYDLEHLSGPSPLKSLPGDPPLELKKEVPERPERRFGLPERDKKKGLDRFTEAGLEAEVMARLTRLETKAKASATIERWKQQRCLNDLDEHQWGQGAMAAFDAIDKNSDGVIDRQEFESAKTHLIRDRERQKANDRRSRSPPRHLPADARSPPTMPAKRVGLPSAAEQAAVAKLESDALKRLGEAMVGMAWRTPMSRST